MWCVRSGRTRRCSCHCMTRWSPSLSGKHVGFLSTLTCAALVSDLSEIPVNPVGNTQATWECDQNRCSLLSWDLQPYWSLTVFLLNQSCFVSQLISTWSIRGFWENCYHYYTTNGFHPKCYRFIWHPVLFCCQSTPSQWKLPGEMVEFRSGEGHRPAS